MLKRVKRALSVLALALLLASTNMTAHAQSKGDQALIDALVRKGVLSEKEAEEISAETAKEAVNTSAAKIQIGDWVKEMKIGGDLRLRFQADQRTPMILTNPLLGPQDRNINRDRWRFRLRLTADFKLAGNFFGGVMLSTSDNRAADTKNATYTGGTISMASTSAGHSWVGLRRLASRLSAENRQIRSTPPIWSTTQRLILKVSSNASISPSSLI
jgi:polyhydroxyalkanoate synthesis regulator phasin